MANQQLDPNPELDKIISNQLSKLPTSHWKPKKTSSDHIIYDNIKNKNTLVHIKYNSITKKWHTSVTENNQEIINLGSYPDKSDSLKEAKYWMNSH